MGCAAAFLNALFDAPREHWFPALVVVDEAQMFAPSASGDVSDTVRRASLSAMTNLMCRGRKRGLAGAIATQRLAKLAKNRSEEHTSELQSLMRISYAVFCLKKKKKTHQIHHQNKTQHSN